MTILAHSVRFNVGPNPMFIMENTSATSSSSLESNDSWNYSDTSDLACWILNDPPPLMLSHKIYLYTSLVFMVLGLVGNSLSILVFSAPEMRVVSSNVYLLVLAISDTIYLLSVFFAKNLTYLRCFFFMDSSADIYNRSDFFCKFLQYLQDLFSSYSTCVILAFTLERYVAVYLPMKFKNLCTVLRARFFCLAIFVVIAAFVLPYHMLYMHRYVEYNVCTVRMSNEKMFTILFAIESLLFRITPVIFITVLNVFIILRVTYVTKQRRRHSNSCSNKHDGVRVRRTHDDRSFQLTVMLILVSMSHVLTYIPVLVHFVTWKLQRSELVDVTHDNMLIARNYTCALYIVGFAINFFLYTVSGKVFRDQLEVLLCARRAEKLKPVTRSIGYVGIITAETDV